MNDKILFYGNSIKDFEMFSKYRNELEKEGFELAYATDNINLLMLLATNKLLLVNPKSYTASIAVVQDGAKINLDQPYVMEWTEFEETVAR